MADTDRSEPPPAVEPPGPVADRAAPAFDDLYRAEWHGLVALGWALTGSWARAEELVQDAFADAYRRWPEVARLDRPGAWVRRAVINRSASQRRRAGVEQRGVARLTLVAEADADGPDADRTAEAGTAHVADPAFWAAVRRLPDRQRAAIALHYLEDRPVAEIAEALGCTAATVKVHLHRARRSLAAQLADHQPHPSDPEGTTR